MKDYRLLAAEAAAPHAGMDPAELADLIQPPPDPQMGDLGLPCFPLAKTLRKNPAQIAAELAEAIGVPDGFTGVAAAGPYLNFRIDTAEFIGGVLRAVREGEVPFGSGREGEGRTVVIDFSSPNIAKPLAIHHIRSTIIGAALARLYAFRGYTVEKVNHLGDWGTNFGQLMVSYKRQEAEHPDETPDIHALLEMYIGFHRDADEDATLQDEAKAWFVKLEEGDPEAVRLWKRFCEASLESFKALYARMNVAFDHYIGESFFLDKMEATLDRIRAAGLAEESEGALVVKLEDEGMPPCLLRKGDGSTLYATRDLAAAEYRYERWRFDKCLYVVANQQELHFRQIFTVLAKMGHDWAGRCEHVKFGMLGFGEGVFADAGGERVTGSTRKGRIVFLEAVLDRAREKARAIILDHAREDAVRDRADALAEEVGVAAVIYNELSQRRMKDVVFTWDRAMNLQGDSGPYLQYTHARLSSVVRRYGKPLPGRIDYAPLGTEEETRVAKTLGRFPEAVARAVRENEPSMVSDYLIELCSDFNRLFTDKEQHRIITDDEPLTLARLGLVDAVRTVLATGLGLLGVAAPERM